MSTLVRPQLTRPRQAQVILEGTVALVTTTLFLWLLIWFIRVTAKPLDIRAFTRADRSGSVVVPFLGPDARALSRVDTPVSFGTTGAGGLSGRVAEGLDQSGLPAVVWIAGPMVAGAGEDAPWGPNNLVETIKKVATSTRRDVLIVLDLAQVDSDLRLGVFGNAPYRELREKLEGMAPPAGGYSVYVLCSSAPGQKSWMIDGIGRSAFGYFVELGLSGDAVGGPGGIWVKDLAEFVRQNTRDWVVNQRRGAIQTPTLLKVGKDDPRPFKLPRRKAPPKPEPATIAQASPPKEKENEKEKEKEKEKDAEKGKDAAAEAKPVAVADPRKDLLKGLIDEWKEHQRLDGENQPRPPYRDAPARWRAYEWSLLDAEKLARAALGEPESDGSAIEEARARLDSAKVRRKGVEDAIKAGLAGEDDFPVRPARRNPVGTSAINEMVKRASTQATPVAPNAPAPAPAAADDGKGTLPDGVKAVLDDALERDRPLPFVEIQAPTWAVRFQSAFEVPWFPREKPRREALQDLVQRRSTGEVALAVDRRGLGWIREEIKAGDQARRQAQDALFDVEFPAELINRRAVDFEGSYKTASDRIDRYHRARSLFEKIAARLPYYGEWAVLSGLASSKPGQDEPLPPRLRDALAAARKLSEALEKREEPADLEAAVDAARKAFQELADEHQDRVLALAGQSSPQWRDLDDVLVSPQISPDDREALLARILLLEKEPPSPRPVAAPDPASPMDDGFRRKALGLARLEVEIRWLANRFLDERAPGWTDIAMQAPAGERAEQATANVLVTLAGATAYAQDNARRPPLPPDRGATPRAEEEILGDLLAQDRAGRLQVVEVAGRAGDQDIAAGRLESFARRSALRFHAERLALDYASADVVRELADAARKIVDVAVAEPEYPADSDPLVPRVDGDAVTIDAKERTAPLKASAEGRVPPGRAFVGVMYDPDKAAVNPADPAAKPSVDEIRLEIASGSRSDRVAGALVDVGPAKPGGPISFLIRQISSAPGGQDLAVRDLDVKTFYRGRVGGEGPESLVHVKCRYFGPEIKIAIAQDLVALAKRIGAPELKNSLRDQFRDHPQQGYLHYKGQLEFNIIVTNNTLEPQVLTVAGDLVGGRKGFLRVDEPLRLAPKASKSYPLTLTHRQVEVDKPVDLEIRVTDARGKPWTEQFSFFQEKLDDYLLVKPSRKRDANYNGTPTDCLVVELNRFQDKNLDPIFFRDIKFFFDDLEAPFDYQPLDYLDVGRGLPALCELKFPRDRNRKIRFRVNVEREDVKASEFPIE